MSEALQTEAEERLALDMSRRKHFRLSCDVRGEFESADGQMKGNLLVRNIGLGGARIDAPIEFPMPSSFVIKLPAQDSAASPQPALDLKCKVAWTVADRAEGPFPTGVQFTGIEGAAKQQLFRYLAAIMR